MTTLVKTESTDKLTKATEQAMSQFQDFIIRGAEGFLEAGRIIVEQTKLDSHFKRKLSERFNLSGAFLDSLERYALAPVDKRLVGRFETRCTRLLRAPLDVQTDALDNGVEILEKANGDWQTRRIPFDELTPEQVRQVLMTDGHLRTQAEQRTWLNSQRKPEPTLRATPGFSVSHQHVIFHQPGKYSRAELLTILAQMEGK